MKSLKTEINNNNLLNDQEFKSLLKFETEYASVIKGGSYPFYTSNEKTGRLVNEVNLLTSRELQETVGQIYISKN